MPRQLNARPYLGGVLALIAYVSFVGGPAGKPTAGGDAVAAGAAAAADAAAPTREVVDGHEALWQLPPGPGPPRGLLLLLHGCSHAAGDFWPRSAACPACLGLPVENALRRAALARGLAVLAVSSGDRASGCWRVDLGGGGGAGAPGGDARAVAAAVRAVRARAGAALAAAPTLVLGASSGGAAALALPRALDGVTAICSQIMAVPPGALSTGVPTLFWHMERDERTAAGVAAALAALRGAGTPAEELRAAPRPVTPAFLESDALNATAAAAVVAALRAGGFLAADGGLLEDPRRSGWRAAAAPHVDAAADGLQPDKSALAELLNLAWARHEIMADGIEAVLDWMLVAGKKSLEELLARPARAAAPG